MSQRDISATIDYIYGFKLSAEQISKITDYVLDEQENWQNRTLAAFYPFLFVDCLFVPIKRDYETEECAFYNILGIRVDGLKEILGLEEGAKAIFPEVVVLHYPPDSQFAKVRPDARLQGLHRSLEKNLRCTKLQSLPRRIRAFLPGLGEISR